jgi:predicted metalloprotease
VAGNLPGQSQSAGTSTCAGSPTNQQACDFSRRVLGSTETVWAQQFRDGRLPNYGAQIGAYQDPTLVVYSNSVETGCGAATAAVGPFYCPNDGNLYIDPSFYQMMTQRLQAPGDFAQAYVIAHEVGHHVQNSIGIMEKVEQARRQGAPMDGANGLSVRQELQADCFAGVWGNRSQAQLKWLQASDIDSALNAASSVGDDTLQKQARGYAVPDSFTHGTSAQRQRWFKAGFASGDIKSCDTFSASSL